jgi:hypothetical protein
MKLVAKVPDSQSKEIQWLVVEKYPSGEVHIS